MIISIKDGIKLVGISIVVFCAVFVCTFFLNFYIDALSIENEVGESSRALFDAQLATARFVCAISGGCLAVIAVILLFFYIKLYIDSNMRRIGIIKAMGYSNGEIALRFGIFGVSVFIGGALGFCAGFAVMPTIYDQMTVEGLDIDIRFHPTLLICLVIAPTVLFTALACGYARLALRKPVSDMLQNKTGRKIKECGREKEKDRSFLKEMCLKTLAAKKSLAFFVAFACFCFSSMVQMSASMKDLSSATMGAIILLIGLVLAGTTMVIAITSLVNGNVKNMSVMRAFGYSMKECALSLFSGYLPFAFIGFGVGTAYQYLLLRLTVDVFFKDVGEIVPQYSFSVPVFFIALVAFILLYSALMLVYTAKINKISVKKVMAED